MIFGEHSIETLGMTHFLVPKVEMGSKMYNRLQGICKTPMYRNATWAHMSGFSNIKGYITMR